MRNRHVAAAIAAAILALAVAAGVASAHALPQSSSPSPGASLQQAPSQVSIVFGERPDAKLSRINVLDSTGASVTSGPTTVSPSNPEELIVPLAVLPPGVYTVAWRTVSAVDGHSAAGSFAFGVGGATPPPVGTPGGSPTTTNSSDSSPAIAARWLLYVGLIVLFGAAFFGTTVGGPAATAVRRLVPAAWLVAAAGTIAVIAIQLADAGVAVGDALDTSFGVPIIERLIPLAIAGIASAWLVARRGVSRPALVVVAVTGALAMLADVLASHAAAGALPILSVPIQWVHVVAVGAWLGGLGGLLLSVRGDPGPRTATLATRFSNIATVGIATVAVSGVLRAIVEVGTVDNLIGTDFGRLVIAKTGLLALLAVLGAANHFFNVPAAGRQLRGLRRVGSTELLVAATVVLLSASLVNLAPPVEAGGGTGPGPGASASPAPTAGPVVALGNDLGTSVRLRLEVSPGVAGFNTFTATATDYDTGAPVPATAVTLRFSLASRPDIGSSRLDLAPSGTGTGVLTGTGPNLSITGTWSIAALVVNGLSSVEVPLTITTACPPGGQEPTPSVSVNAVPGLPTIYTAPLSAGRTVQVYFDPGTAGANEEHVTFFDAAGNELPVQTVSMQIGPASCMLSALTPRQLEPGHFVADTQLTTGTWFTSISGPAPNGDQLSAALEITVP